MTLKAASNQISFSDVPASFRRQYPRPEETMAKRKKTEVMAHRLLRSMSRGPVRMLCHCSQVSTGCCLLPLCSRYADAASFT